MVIVVVINIILISIVIIAAVIIIIMIVIMVGWLWLRGTASVSLLEGRWFDYPGLHVFGQDTEPQTAPDVLVDTLHSSHRLQCMYEYTVSEVSEMYNCCYYSYGCCHYHYYYYYCLYSPCTRTCCLYK